MSKQCSERVFGHRDVTGHQCPRKAKVERDGKWFCKQHDPVAAAERRARSQAKFDAEWAERRKKADRQRAYSAFFHGADIPTERIPEGGVMGMVDLLRKVANHTCFAPRDLERVQAILAKAGVE